MSQQKDADGSAIYLISSTIDENEQNKEIWRIKGAINGMNFNIGVVIETNGINVNISKYAPDRIPIGIKPTESATTNNNGGRYKCGLIENMEKRYPKRFRTNKDNF